MPNPRSIWPVKFNVALNVVVPEFNYKIKDMLMKYEDFVTSNLLFLNVEIFGDKYIVHVHK